MKATIQINMTNAAFEDTREVSRILRVLADNVDGRDLLPGETITLRDVNGNPVGTLKTSA